MLSSNLLSLPLAASAAETSGELVGILIAIGLLGWGVVKCIRVMRRPAASTQCVSALLILLCTWFLSGLVNLGIKLLRWPPETVLISMPMVALLAVGAVVVAIAGLAFYDSTRFTQGRAQAIWAIVLGSIGAIGTVMTFVGVLPQLLPGAFAKTGRREELPRFNCVLTPPPGWRSTNPKRFGNDLAALAYFRGAPEIYMVLLPEVLSEGALNLESFAGTVKQNLAAAAQVLDQKEEDQVVAGGFSFRRIMTTARLATPKMDIYYEHWVAAKGGYFWQLMVWGKPALRDEIAAEARKFAQGFGVLDSTKTISQGGTLTDVARPRQGYATHLAGLGWNPGGKQMEGPLVDFTAQRAREAVIVVPLQLPQPAPDFDAVANGLMAAAMEFKYPPAEGILATRPMSLEVGEGKEIETERSIGSRQFRYVLRVIRNETQAWLLAGWAEKQTGDLELVRRSLDAIELHAPDGHLPQPTATERGGLKTVFNQIGLSYFMRRQYAPAEAWFRRAFEQTNDDSTVLDNVANAIESGGRKKEALDLIEIHAARFPKAFDLQLRKAGLLAELGDAGAGNALFLELLERGLNKESDLLAWLKTLARLKRHDLAVAAADAWVAKQPGLKSRRWLAEVLAGNGEEKRAIEILEKLAAQNPDDEAIVCQFAEVLNDGGEYSRAGDTARQWLDRDKENVRASMALGWSQMGRQWYRDAKATFERAARNAPDDEAVQTALRRASAALGQGSNTDIKQPLDPVPMPPEVEHELAALPERADFGKGYPAVFLRRSVGYEVAKGKPLRHTIRRRVKVLDQTGVDSFSTFKFEFDPLGERIFPNRVEVFDSDGKSIAKGAIDDAFVRDADPSEASHRKALSLQVPGLRPGCIVEVEVTIENRSVEEDFPHTRHLFAYMLPCAADAVFVVGEPALVSQATTHSDQIKSLHDGKLAAWFTHALPAWENEPFPVPSEQTAPTLWLGSKRQTWADVGREYLADIADRLKPDAGAAAFASQLTRGLKTPREKIAVLARAVQKDISYKAIEFGVRARHPNAAADTLRQRFGDCKDHALLLHQLLRAAGVETHLALVNTSLPIQPDLPSLDQFNHMVLHVPALGESWLLDPTDKHVPLEALPAGTLWTSHALLLDPAKARLIAPPAPPREGSATVESHRTIVPGGTDWLVEEKLTIHGYYAAWMRGNFTGESAAEQTRHAQRILAENGPAELQEFHFENIDELGQPARLSMSYRVRNSIKITGNKATGTLPALWERDYLAMTFLPGRKTPFVFRFPFHFSSDVEMKLPPETHVALTAPKLTGVFASCTLESTKPAAAGTWKLRYRFDAHPGEHSAGEYAGFYAAWEAARRVWDGTLEWPVR